MKRMMKKFCVMLSLVFLLSMIAGNTVYAASDYQEEFDFEKPALKMNAGETKEMKFESKHDYTYFVSAHTSKWTRIECKYNQGSEQIKIHIGPDETTKNVYFYFYVRDGADVHQDRYATLSVEVVNYDPVFTDPTTVALKSYQYNNSEFNAYYYYVNYPDLQTAFGKDPVALYNHYYTFGKQEKRIANMYRYGT